MSRHVVQTISGETTKRNREKRSVLPHCHRQASLKRLVQENANGKEHHMFVSGKRNVARPRHVKLGKTVTSKRNKTL